MDSLAILLLSGGYSRRMGQNKANLKIGGQTFAEKIAAELSCCGPVYLSVSADISPDFTASTEKYPRIVDEVPHIGPLGGISAAMHQTDADTYFVCACDMPRMSANFVQHLARIWDQIGTGFHVPSDSNTFRKSDTVAANRQRPDVWDALLVRNQTGRIYTTAGIYHRSMLPQIDKQIRDKNYRLRDLLTASSVFYVEENSLGELKDCLANVNTMEEYRKLNRMNSI